MRRVAPPGRPPPRLVGRPPRSKRFGAFDRACGAPELFLGGRAPWPLLEVPEAWLPVGSPDAGAGAGADADTGFMMVIVIRVRLLN